MSTVTCVTDGICFCVLDRHGDIVGIAVLISMLKKGGFMGIAIAVVVIVLHAFIYFAARSGAGRLIRDKTDAITPMALGLGAVVASSIVMSVCARLLLIDQARYAALSSVGQDIYVGRLMLFILVPTVLAIAIIVLRMVQVAFDAEVRTVENARIEGIILR